MQGICKLSAFLTMLSLLLSPLLLQEEDGASALVTREMSSFLHSLVAANKVL
jgi:hypothetical protein